MDPINIITTLRVPSNLENPSNTDSFTTRRSLLAEYPENTTILNRIDLTSLSQDVINCTSSSATLVGNSICKTFKDLYAVYGDTIISDSLDLFESGFTPITSLDELKRLLSEVLIRFDTTPKHYTKDDYFALLKVLYKSLLYLYSSSLLGIESLNDNLIVTIVQNIAKLDLKIGLIADDTSNGIATVQDIRNYINEFVKWKIDP